MQLLFVIFYVTFTIGNKLLVDDWVKIILASLEYQFLTGCPGIIRALNKPRIHAAQVRTKK